MTRPPYFATAGVTKVSRIRRLISCVTADLALIRQNSRAQDHQKLGSSVAVRCRCGQRLPDPVAGSIARYGSPAPRGLNPMVPFLLS